MWYTVLNRPTAALSRQCSLLLTKQSFHHLRTKTGGAVGGAAVAGQSTVVPLAAVDADTVHIQYDALITYVAIYQGHT